MQRKDLIDNLSRMSTLVCMGNLLAASAKAASRNNCSNAFENNFTMIAENDTVPASPLQGPVQRQASIFGDRQTL